MYRLFSVVVFLFTILAVSASAWAEDKADASRTGNWFTQKCPRKTNNLSNDLNNTDLNNALYCIGYVSGLTDGIAAQKAIISYITDKKIPYDSMPPCAYGTITYGQNYDVLAKFIEDNPAERNLDLGMLASTAFLQAWPCKTSFPKIYTEAERNEGINLASEMIKAMPKPTCLGSFCYYWK